MQDLQWDFYNYIVSLLLTGITTLGLGIFVLLKNRHVRVNQLFFAVSITMSIWGFSQSCIHSNYVISFVAGRITHFIVPFIAIFSCHFLMTLAERQHKRFLIFAYVFAFIFSMLGGFSTSIVAGLHPFRISDTLVMRNVTYAGRLYIPYTIFFSVVSSYGIFTLYKVYRKTTGSRRIQFKYMLLAAIMGFAGGSTNFLYMFSISIYPITPYATYTVPFYVAISTYAIIKHRLMDVKIALSRTGLLLIIYGLIIYFSFQVVVFLQPYLSKSMGRAWVLFPVAMYTLLISFAPFIYLYILKKMEEKLFKRQRQYQKTLKHLSSGMTRIRNLAKLLDLTAIQIVRTVRVTHTDIFLFNKDKNSYVLKVSRGGLKKEPGLIVEPDNVLIKGLYYLKRSLVYDETDKYNIDNKNIAIQSLKNTMHDLGAAVCIPGFIENRLIGFVILGNKLSGEAYTREDLDVFATLTNQVTLAIDNAQSYEELVSTKDQLLKGERLATIGEFASEVAHEIKNPLQAIRTFTELAYEKRNDTSFMAKFSKLARQEVDRINNFVRQLIKVAHPLPPKLGYVSINEVLNSVLELMENDFNVSDITVKKEYGLHPKKIIADKDQLKQVFLNLITNAIESMETSEKKVISVSTEESGPDAIIRISDTGCGISNESMPNLFNPLFTTKENGSGLGLSIVDTIIKNHNGIIDVKSSTSKGTTFSIAIPIKQSKAA